MLAIKALQEPPPRNKTQELAVLDPGSCEICSFSRTISFQGFCHSRPPLCPAPGARSQGVSAPWRVLFWGPCEPGRSDARSTRDQRWGALISMSIYFRSQSASFSARQNGQRVSEAFPGHANSRVPQTSGTPMTVLSQGC